MFRKFLYFKQRLFLIEAISWNVILIDQLFEFLSRVKDGHPNYVKSQLIVPFISLKAGKHMKTSCCFFFQKKVVTFFFSHD